MAKPTVTKFFVGSLIAIAGGLGLFFVTGALAYANGSFVMNGPDVVGIQSTPFAWSMVALSALGILAMVGGAIGQLVAWIGAVVNTALLPDKTWFLVLLLLGLLSFGFVAMIVYVIAGPDGTAAEIRPRAMPARPVPTA